MNLQHRYERRPSALFLLTIAGFAPALASAADPTTVSSVFEDAKEYVTAPIRWDREDWAYFGVTAVVLAAAHQYDDNARAHFATGARAKLGGSDPNSLRDAAPAVAIVAGTFLYAGLLGDHDGYQETYAMLEAGAFSAATGEVLKLAAGRERPDMTTSPDKWREGGSSFPSIHATAAFAIGTVFAESGNDEYRWIRRIVGYGVASGTAYIRVRDNVHWVSDTVAGAALGIATARFVLNRQTESSDRASLGILPTRNGWMLSYSVATR